MSQIRLYFRSSIFVYERLTEKNIQIAYNKAIYSPMRYWNHLFCWCWLKSDYEFYPILHNKKPSYYKNIETNNCSTISEEPEMNFWVSWGFKTSPTVWVKIVFFSGIRNFTINLEQDLMIVSRNTYSVERKKQRNGTGMND